MPDESDDLFDPVEHCEWRSPRRIFADLGYFPSAPDELDDLQLRGRLWELIYAAAGRRIYLYDTDHLSDRELYSLLWREWLDRPTADIPLDAGTYTRVCVADFDANGMTADEIWMRFYAGEDGLRAGQEDDSAIENTKPRPCDRDGLLPVPPIPLTEHSGCIPGDPEPGEGEEYADSEHAHEDEAATPFQSSAEDEEMDPYEQAQLEAELAASEPENWLAPTETFKKERIPLLPPAEITDETLAPILWELLHNLALHGFYVLNTDHLSDRDLYADLWHHGLREPAGMPGRNMRGGWFHDMIGSGSDEHMDTWLRYFASDEDRAEHAARYPDEKIPPKEKRPYNRDWRLPKGPF